MIAVDPQSLEFSESWQDGDPTARWRSAVGHETSMGASSSGSSLLEIDPRYRLPRHTDSAEEIIVVLSGTAEVVVDTERALVHADGLVLVPKGVPHEVLNGGEGVLRFAAIYAEPEVVTEYEREIQPDGAAARQTVS